MSATPDPAQSGCPHGLVGFCPDCPPERWEIGTDLVAGPHAEAIGRTVWRYKPNGALDWVTQHLTKWGARRAAARYMRDGKVTGHRP